MTAPTFATGFGTANPFIGGVATNAGLPDKKLRRSESFEYNLASFTGTTGQSIVLMNIPAHTQIDSIQVINPTAVASGNTISVGDSTSTTLYVNGATPTTANTVLTQAITTNPLNYYKVVDELVLTVTNATLPTTGILRFVINMTDCSRNIKMTTQS